MRFASRWLNTLAGLVIFAIAVYRAATMAFTIDEAMTYVNYVQHGWKGIFHGSFDANNHILYSILEKFCRQWFGMSELSLRVPALLGAALFLWSLARLCSMLVPGSWFSLLSFLIVSGNPLMLDFMAAARGYGLALGLLAFALLEWLEWLDDEESKRVWRASVALGLAAAANLIFIVPLIAMLAVATAALLSKQRYRLIPVAVLPAVVIPLALWWAPFQVFNKDAFYLGVRTLHEMLESFEVAVFVHDVTRGDPFGNWVMLYDLGVWILPLLVPLLWAGTLFWLRRRPALAFATAVFGVTCFGTWLAHAWLGVLYPLERTGLGIIFLFLLTWTAAIGACWHTNWYSRWFLAFPNLLLALVFLMQFGGQFDPRYLSTWRLQWKMNEVMSQLRGRPGKVRTHWIYQSTAEYYRLRWKLPLKPIVREPDKFELNHADYFILPLPTQEDVAATRLRVLYRDEVTGTTLLQSQGDIIISRGALWP